MALAAAAGGVGLQAYGMYMQGQAAVQRGRMVKGADEYEAQQYEIQGQQQAEYLQRQSTRAQGRNEATEAAGNVDITQGSPALAILDQVTQDQKAIAITASNAQHKALAARMAGEIGIETGAAQETGANISAAGGLLSGGSRIAGMTSRGQSPMDYSDWMGG